MLLSTILHTGTFALGERAMPPLARLLLAIVVLARTCTTGVRAEMPGEWVKLGARVHGGFGSFIPAASATERSGTGSAATTR